MCLGYVWHCDNGKLMKWSFAEKRWIKVSARRKGGKRMKQGNSEVGESEGKEPRYWYDHEGGQWIQEARNPADPPVYHAHTTPTAVIYEPEVPDVLVMGPF